MFAIGEIKAKVCNGKVALPKEYQLRKKNIIGKWKNENILYLSDSDSALNYAAGREGAVFEIDIDVNERLRVPSVYEQGTVRIEGCISTIRLVFEQ